MSLFKRVGHRIGQFILWASALFLLVETQDAFLAPFSIRGSTNGLLAPYEVAAVLVGGPLAIGCGILVLVAIAKLQLGRALAMAVLAALLLVTAMPSTGRLSREVFWARLIIAQHDRTPSAPDCHTSTRFGKATCHYSCLESTENFCELAFRGAWRGIFGPSLCGVSLLTSRNKFADITDLEASLTKLSKDFRPVSIKTQFAFGDYNVVDYCV